MKCLVPFFVLLSIVTQAQTDTSTFRSYDNTFHTLGEKHRDVKWINSRFEVLVIVGDSLYNTLSEAELKSKLYSSDYRMDIINNPDSISNIISKRIKSIMILTPREKVKKQKP